MSVRTTAHPTAARSSLPASPPLSTLSACGSSSDPLASSSSTASAAASGVGLRLRFRAAGGQIVIGSANFPESALIANIYAEALKAKGIDVSTNLNIGSREVYIKAIEDGSINLVPEYTGVLLQYFDKTATAVSSDDVYAALQGKLPTGLRCWTSPPPRTRTRSSSPRTPPTRTT